jgi:uncharacterized protein YndB with AHSA1/START domain
MKVIGFSLLGILGLLAVAAAIIFLMASRLPEQHSVSRSIKLKQKPADVYATVSDFGSAASWRQDITKVEILGSVEGHVRFRQHGSDGVVTYEVVEDKPPEKLVTRIVDRDLGYSGSSTYLIEPSAEGTTIRIREDGVVSNLLFRFMSRYVFGHTATIDAYLTALAKRFGEGAIPEASEPF